MGTAVRAETDYRPPCHRARSRRDRASTPRAVLAATPRVLLLNASYEALTALPARRAVVMLLCGKADVVHERPDAVMMRSVDTAIRVPSVIRLREYVRIPYRAQVPMTRAALMYRDAYRCGYCNAKATTIDHVIPRSRGGAHGWQNCVASCAPCNRRKADRLLSELGWELRVSLDAPQGRTWRLASQLCEMGPHWEDYLYLDAA